MTDQILFNKNWLPPQERAAVGKSLRKQVPRSSHGEWVPAADRPDPIELLQKQDEGRLAHLLPIKYGRMLASPFAFLRGSAVVMASDLASSPVTGLDVVLCGDAHLSNFGFFATPERNLVFDINDFDEAYPGPWEWDLKRLAASAVVAGRQNGFKEKDNRKLAEVVAKNYRKAMMLFSKESILNVWYYHVNADELLNVIEKHSKENAKTVRKTVKKARKRTAERTLQKMTEVVDGKRQFRNEPPLLIRLHNLLSDEQKQKVTRQDVESYWQMYVSSLPMERQMLLKRFRMSELALRVGGVGSVGTRTTVLLLEGDTEKDGLILQQKEADKSALEEYLPKHDFKNPAQRVVVAQRLMQAASDIFLGWTSSSITGIHFYWRQLKDQKGSFDVQDLDVNGMVTYLAVCSVSLARAHARTGDAAAISGYLGSGDQFIKAIGKFAQAYADQTEKDYQALVDAVKAGRIVVQEGI